MDAESMETEIKCPPETLFHCLTHFEKVDDASRTAMLDAGYTDVQIRDQLNRPGSKFHAFFAQSPMQVLDRLKMECPDRLSDMPEPDASGKVRLSFDLGYEIGTDGVIAMDALAEEELSTMREEERNGCMIRKVSVSRIVPTNECQVILGKEEDEYSIITVFPGVMAPPLPRNGEPDLFWDSHCFIDYQ